MTDEFHDDRLRYLYESVRHGTMRAASEFLDVAPSSVSRQIASLERDLGISLVEKGRHTVRLTSAGEMAIEYYRDRLAHRESLISALDDLRGKRSGNVTIAMGEGFIGAIVLGALKDYASRYPGIRLAVLSGATTQVMGLVREDEAHFGIVFEPPPDARIRTRIAIPQPLRLIAHSGHPLGKRREVRIADLVGHKLVLPDQNFRARHLVHEMEVQADVRLDVSLTTGSLRLLKGCVVYDMGATIMNEMPFTEELQNGQLVSIPLAHPSLSETSAQAITRVGRQLPGSVLSLLELLEARMNETRRASAA
jgi:DNA-binding transcriptional LysR family regulator